jgi:Ca-activated chloride channel family protein
LFVAIIVAPIGVAAPTGVATPFLVIATPGVKAGALPLASTSIDARIVGNFAEVRLRQHYTNLSTATIEAAYVVPAAPDVALHRLEITLGDRVLRGVVREKAAARDEYIAARREGRKASLLEQYGSAQFRLTIANIDPGQSIEVDLGYSQLLPSQAGVYELALAPPIAARYGDERAVVGRSGVLQINIELEGGVPLADVESLADQAGIERVSPSAARIHATRAAADGRLDPFLLRYRLRGDAIADGIVVEPDEGGGYFLLQVQPPVAATPANVLPRDYLFVIDTSGSMHGYGLESVRYLMAQLLSTMTEDDRFNVVTFDAEVRAFRPAPVRADRRSIERAVAFLEAGDWAENPPLIAAIDRALAYPPRTMTSRTVVLVTDGQVSIDLGELRSRASDANLSPVGMGWGVRSERIAALARVGGAEPYFAIDPTIADVEIRRFSASNAAPLVTDVRVAATGITLDAIAPDPQPDLFAERPLIVTGRYRGETGEIVVSGLTRDGPWRRSYRIAASVPAGRAIAQLWARARVGGLLDLLKAEDRVEWRREVTQLAIEHQIATPYTSFVAVEERESSVRPERPPKDDRPEGAKPPAEPGAGEMLAGVRGYAAGAATIDLDLSGAVAGPDRSAGECGVGGSTPGREVLRVRRASRAHRALLALLPQHATCLALPGASLHLDGMTFEIVDGEGLEQLDDELMLRLTRLVLPR